MGLLDFFSDIDLGWDFAYHFLRSSRCRQHTLTEKGEREFERLMMDISAQPVRLFLDFNAVIVNLDSLPPETQVTCIAEIEKNINELTKNLKENFRQKEDAPEVPETGMAVLRQQMVLAQALEGWIAALKEHLSSL